ncbi:glycosyltransferase family 2 protein [Pontibacter ramchanderi]|uniref:Glycosyltransferase involved in cell wall biosynthesis n=1 Tax=Pontibacter ramchanderi TaxID=1179743 RepID=A0A2N3U7S4_9BACT|nr:glycosyltransferase family 2 protein [Pontibacter ramchanderi]PKV62784.1 glycosyltransferase involved in cell wall biosynthesis [Pontibacter ramchanderi]
MATTLKPKVSIITCFFNTEQFIVEAIESVLSQTFTDWELLLIDDGSTDASTQIAKGYASKYPGHIRYYEHAAHINKGLSASRNKGLSEASGDLIAFLDADDVWLPDYLLNQVNLMEQLSVTMVCEATEYWYSWSDASKEDKHTPVGVNASTVYNPPQLMLSLYPLNTGAAPCMCSILIRKDALLKHGGFDESFTGMYEDQIFLSKIYMNEPIYVSHLCNNRYRQRPGSLVNSSTKADYHQVRARFLYWFQMYFSKKSLENPYISKSLKKALWPYQYPMLNKLMNMKYKSLGKRLKRILFGRLRLAIL